MDHGVLLLLLLQTFYMPAVTLHVTTTDLHLETTHCTNY